MSKKINLIIGQKFTRLTVLEAVKNNWKCQCDCGNIIIVSAGYLNSGNKKSCGCLKTEPKSKELKELIGNRSRKFTPETSSARRVWRSYYYNDERCNLTFEQFFELSQQNCFYCGIEPSNQYNYFLFKKDASSKAKKEGLFIYNGLDRIDSNLPHIYDNCVTCCFICNRAKNNRSKEDFYEYINKLLIKDILFFDIKNIILPENKYIKASCKSAFRVYEKEDITLEEFYYLSQLPCFYCNTEFLNKVNSPLIDKKSSQKAKDEGWFYYNGLDRIDSTKNHNLNNIVPCCKYCNFAKGKLSLAEFQDWIRRIRNFNKM